jgi:ABC-type uncharacterized transport system substrate-binding protein
MNGVKRIVAVAVGPQRDSLINVETTPTDIRPYVVGLIAGLAKSGRKIGVDYEIDYKERSQLDLTNENATAVFAGADQTPYDLIFAMSTNVVRAAKDTGAATPIVGVVSDSRAEGLHRARNITGISAQRSQTAGQCFEHFLATVPTLKRVRVLHKPGYGPSDRSLKLVKAAAKKRGVTVQVVTIKTRDDIEKKLKAMTKRNRDKPAELGVLVLPVDVCLGAAQLIIDLAQGQKNLPTFFPVTDFVRRNAQGALGGYGVPQHTCGVLMAEYVDHILWGLAEPRALKVANAGTDDFEWVVSSEAAKALNVGIARVI